MRASGNSRPILTLLAIATVLPELFTGSTPITGFFNPGMLIFLFIGYGVAVLLVRELAVRFRSGLLGLFFLGLGYSILNEGLWAKTLVISKALPVNQYDQYGYAWGISFPWMAGIACWHAVASVMVPILIAHHLFPEKRTEPWLRGWTSLVLGAVLMFLSCAAFLGTSAKGVTGSASQLGILLFIMSSCFILGVSFNKPIELGSRGNPLKPILLGLSVIIPFWGLVFVAGLKKPVPVYFATLIAVIFFYAWNLKRGGWLSVNSFLLFGLGWYLHNVLQSTLIIGVAMRNPVLGLATLAVNTGILIVLYRVIIGRQEGAEVVTV